MHTIFILDEESDGSERIRNMLDAVKAHAALLDMYQWFRNELKHNEKLSDLEYNKIEEAREKLNEIVRAYNIEI